ncbi:MAG: hypothetical protein AAB955_01680 [Patescibacteria group bacterium]
MSELTPREIADRALKGYIPKRLFILGAFMAIGTIIGSVGLLDDFLGFDARDDRNNPLLGLLFGVLGGGIAVSAYDIATVSIPLAKYLWRKRNDPK